MADSSHKFIKRNRPPRVHITYEDPYDAERKVELPFVMGVLADLSGNASAVDKPEMDKREFTEFDMDNFEKRMASIDPAVRFNVDDRLSGTQQKMSVELHFRKMDDFGPASVARQVPALAKLLEAREQLSNLLRYMDGKVAASDQIKALLQDPSLMEALAQRLAPPSSDNPAS
ncbi:MAG: type VI secretion system contractile sheath small subunit [Terriglobus roseus]|nr:type VI secretion system contractile sheath small subunit [Terriglobus roseus]